MKTALTFLAAFMFIASALRADDGRQTDHRRAPEHKTVQQQTQQQQVVDRTSTGICSGKIYDPLSLVFKDRSGNTGKGGVFGPGASVDVSGMVGVRFSSR